MLVECSACVMVAKINLRYELHGDSAAYRQSWTEDFAFGYVLILLKRTGQEVIGCENVIFYNE